MPFPVTELSYDYLDDTAVSLLTYNPKVRPRPFNTFSFMKDIGIWIGKYFFCMHEEGETTPLFVPWPKFSPFLDQMMKASFIKRDVTIKFWTPDRAYSRIQDSCLFPCGSIGASGGRIFHPTTMTERPLKIFKI